MLRIAFITFLSIATLLTAAAWYLQVSGKSGLLLNLSQGSRIVFAGQYNTAYLGVRWGPLLRRDQYLIECRFGIPGIPIDLLQEIVQDSRRAAPRTAGWAVRSHLWLSTALTSVGWAAYPVLARKLLRRKRRKRGLCLDCGYDLTGNESGKCSECGVGISP